MLAAGRHWEKSGIACHQPVTWHADYKEEKRKGKGSSTTREQKFIEIFAQALGISLLPSITAQNQALHPLCPTAPRVPAVLALVPAISPMPPTSPRAPGSGNTRKMLSPAPREGSINPIIFICLQIFICSLAEMISRSLSGLLSCYYI